MASTLWQAVTPGAAHVDRLVRRHAAEEIQITFAQLFGREKFAANIEIVLVRHVHRARNVSRNLVERLDIATVTFLGARIHYQERVVLDRLFDERGIHPERGTKARRKCYGCIDGLSA